MANCKSMNNAITSILMGKLNVLNSWRKFRHRRLNLRAKKRVGVATQLRGSSKIDAPPCPTPPSKKQKPDREETGRANDWLSLLLPGSGRQRSGFGLIEQLAYPTVSDSASTEIIGSSPVLCRR
jgi:hypothetical protein